MIEPVVDFSLMKINTSSRYRINVENTSPIPSEILIKPFKQDHIDFNNYMKYSDILKCSFTSEGNAIKIDKPIALIPPFSRQEFLITVDCIRQETLEEYFDILVKDSDSPLYF